MATAPTIALVTEQRMRSITSQNLHEIDELPHVYIATSEPDVMVSWGVAHAPRADYEGSAAENERLYPGALVAPRFQGRKASRADLLYYGAEPAALFVKRG